jgi:predicted transcriptional regulator
MNTENNLISLPGTEEHASLATVVKEWEESCQNCHPLTPIACVTSCKIWEVKNEFRKLYEKMKHPSFMTKLLNTLKNKRRLQILEIISKGRYSISGLQQGLKKLGYYHSRKTIAEEYVNPLMDVGLIEENQNRYHATVFGCRLNESIKNSREIEEVLPPHSECYEEMALEMLSHEPRIFEDFAGIIQAKSVARVLNRLQRAGLIETGKEKSYVFFFKTKRDSDRARFSPTEKRIYENIQADGDSAQKLAEKTGISLRRTYKYLRKLKGKKMVFARKKPKSYALTAKGYQTASMLDEVRNLAAEVLAMASQLVKSGETYGLSRPDTSLKTQGREEKEIIPLATSQHVKQD